MITRRDRLPSKFARTTAALVKENLAMQPRSIADRAQRLKQNAAQLARCVWWPAYLADTRGGMGLPEVDLLAAKRELEAALDCINDMLDRCEKNQEKAA